MNTYLSVHTYICICIHTCTQNIPIDADTKIIVSKIKVPKIEVSKIYFKCSKSFAHTHLHALTHIYMHTYTHTCTQIVPMDDSKSKIAKLLRIFEIDRARKKSRACVKRLEKERERAKLREAEFGPMGDSILTE